MGGLTDPISTVLKNDYREEMELAEAVQLAVRALSASASNTASAANGDNNPGVGKLEVAVLERSRPKRAFRRLEGAALTALLPAETSPAEPDSEGQSPDVQENGG
jgi:proteasome alpha subunit